MVPGIDDQFPPPCPFGQPRTRVDPEGVKCSFPVLQGTLPFGGQILDKLSATDDIEQLEAAANPKHGTPNRQGFTSQDKLQFVPRTIDPYRVRRDNLSVANRRHIGAARQDPALTVRGIGGFEYVDERGAATA